MEELVIRHAGMADLADLLTLYTHLNSHDEVYPAEEAKERLDQIERYAGSGILIGTLHGQLVASCTLIVIPNLTRGGRSYALIENVVTHRSWRRRGFGAALLKAAADQAWQHGCYKVMLLTGLKEPGTLAFYEKAGFEQSKTGFQMRAHP
ncbi:GNAT family N-acetyltransferase [Novosphingobium terrae]|uniref:GNAT family N-acetyltransferase n=1 Tax=Novosphingobium terrae TaxID=2726189 RepID=UPI0019819247|nr:GNAT family N-acetyltransferase [Novosphingobium terrae]